MGIQAEMHVVRIGGDHHMVKFTGAFAKFGVVIMVGEFHPHPAQRCAQFVECPCLGGQLCIVLVFWSSPADRDGIGDDDFGPEGLCGRGYFQYLGYAGSRHIRLMQRRVHIKGFAPQSGFPKFTGQPIGIPRRFQAGLEAAIARCAEHC